MIYYVDFSDLMAVAMFIVYGISGYLLVRWNSTTKGFFKVGGATVCLAIVFSMLWCFVTFFLNLTINFIPSVIRNYFY